MEQLKWKIRISILWVVLVVNHIANVFLSNMEGTSPMTPISLAIWFFVACLMAWLSVTLKNSVNRYLNIIFGILFVIPKIVHLIEGLTSDSYGLTVNCIWGLLAALLIIGHAWKWPKQEA